MPFESYTEFESYVFDGKQIAVDELKLRPAIRSQIDRYIVSPTTTFETSSPSAKTNEFVRWVEAQTNVPVNADGSFISDGEEVPRITGPAVFSNPRINIRKQFIVAVWFYFHTLEEKSFAEAIDQEILGKKLSEIPNPTYAKIKSRSEKFGKESLAVLPDETPSSEIVDDKEEEGTNQVPTLYHEEQPNLRNADPRGDIYTYGYDQDDKIDVLGRTGEQETLRAFLDGPPGFMWLQVAGAAGQGKSRLAWELVKTARNEMNFAAGFMEADDLIAFQEKWLSWKPNKAHLIVVDYIIDRDKPVGQMMAVLIERAAQLGHPVRILLLDRQRYDRGEITRLPKRSAESGKVNRKEEEPEFQLSESENASWFNALVRDAEHINPSIDLLDRQYLFKGHGILELKRLDEAELLKITKQVSATRSQEKPVHYSDNFIQTTLKRFDGAGRPLYAYFLGIALAGNAFKKTWDRGDLLNHVLTTEKEKRWSRMYGKSAPNMADNLRSLHLAVFATIVRVVDRFDVQKFDDWKTIADDDVEQALVLVNGPITAGVAAPGDIVPALYPDLLGEWFVLSVLRRQAQQLPKILTAAWETDPSATAAFLQRVAQDFPMEAAARGVIEFVPNDLELYKVYCDAAGPILSALHQSNIEDPPNVLTTALEAAADSGNAVAMRMLGIFYWYGYGFEKSFAESLRWTKKGANREDPLAMANLSFFYLKGDGANIDCDKAFEWAMKAAKLFEVRGYVLLHYFYSNGIGVVQDKNTAINYLKKSVNKGHLEALLHLANCYKYGDGVEKNPAQAADWFRKAAEAGDPNAMSSYGVCYSHGEGVKKDLAQAVVWFRKAADAGESTAMLNLGISYKNGDGLEKNLAEAVDWFRKAADAGESTAMLYLGISYKNGDGLEKNLAEAVYWFRKAADAGDTAAMRVLGSSYEKGDGVEKNLTEAIDWFRKAADAGDIVAMLILGVIFENGDGVEKNPEQALHWFRKAAYAGDTAAMLQIGFIHQYGDGLEKNPVHAVNWFRKTVMRFFGGSYENGNSVEKNPVLAVEWYRKAADAGNTLAMRTVGACYEKGDGVEKNLVQAVEWYRKAFDAGDKEERSIYATLSAIVPIDPLTFSGESRAVVPIVDLTSQWRESPPLKSDWIDADEKEVREISSKLAAAADLEDKPGTFEGLRITALRQTEIACYKELKLVDVQLIGENGNARFVSALVSEFGAVLLDGTSPRLYTLNRHCLSLNTAEKRESYLRFFCEFVRRNNRPMHVIERMSDIPCEDNETIQFLFGADAKIGPIQFTDPDKQEAPYAVKATFLYSHYLFASEFFIPNDGMLDIRDDDPIATCLPISRRTYDGIFRSTLD